MSRTIYEIAITQIVLDAKLLQLVEAGLHFLIFFAAEVFGLLGSLSRLSLI
jgi:hypothetical protein